MIPIGLFTRAKGDLTRNIERHIYKEVQIFNGLDSRSRSGRLYCGQLFRPKLICMFHSYRCRQLYEPSLSSVPLLLLLSTYCRVEKYL